MVGVEIVVYVWLYLLTGYVLWIDTVRCYYGPIDRWDDALVIFGWPVLLVGWLFLLVTRR